jgi:hypothetical protein
MSQIRPIPLVQQPDKAVKQADITDLSATGTLANPLTQSTQLTSPLMLLTDQPVEITTGHLVGKPSVASTSARVIRIPGSRKRLPTTEPLPKAYRLNPRLRHGIVLVALVLVGLTTLLSLAPLDNGQSLAMPIFTNISNWVHAEQANWQIQAHLQGLMTPVAQNNPAPPPMTLPKSAYIAIAQQDAINAGISPDYFVRQINLESGFNPNASSPMGAEGIAQFMPRTAAGLGIDPWNPNQALNAAAQMMAGYSKTYGGDYAKALAAYNGGSGTVQYAVNSCGAANWMNCLPGETRNYIRTIMGI